VLKVKRVQGSTFIYRHLQGNPDQQRFTQREHFPDHMKFPDFSLTFPVEASKDYPVSSVYRYGQQLLFHINEKQGEDR